MGECFQEDEWTGDGRWVPGSRSCVMECPHVTQGSDWPVTMESARKYGDGGQHGGDAWLKKDTMVFCDIDLHDEAPSLLWVQRTVRIRKYSSGG